MTPEELLKFLPVLAKAKKIGTDWKQTLIDDKAWKIDGETIPQKRPEVKEPEAKNSKQQEKTPNQDEKGKPQIRTRKRSEISKFI